MSREKRKDVIMLRLWSWGKGWWPDFRGRASQAGRQFFGCLGMSTLIIFVFAIASYYLVLVPSGVSLPGGPGTLEWWIQMTLLIVLLYVFIPYLVVVFFLSLHPKTRLLADKLSLRLFGQTELDKLKVKVESTDKELRKIKNRLGRINKTLKTLGSKGDRGGKWL